MATTSAPYVPRKSGEILGLGPAEHAGPCSTLGVSRNGLQTKVLPRLANKPRMANCLPHANGDAQDVTCLRMYCRTRSLAGVKRKPILSLYLGFPPFRVARHGMFPYFSSNYLLSRQDISATGPKYQFDTVRFRRMRQRILRTTTSKFKLTSFQF